MVSVAEEKDAGHTIIDTRSSAEYAGIPGSTLINRDRNEYVAFEGHIQSAINLDYKNLLVDGSNESPLIQHDALERVMKKHGITDKNISFVYGSNGQKDAVLFLVLDAELNWPVKLYDGGWSQWGQMAGNTPETGGMLQKDSPWRTDIAARSESISYNKSGGFTVAEGASFNSYATHGDDINRMDLELCGKTGENLITRPAAPGY
jgi:rhodanese-related sulfurtransferase